ncbi:hypothetical protein BX666DRAFT_2029017 [Dichotomocladium elegans]|nr:hypothetical protein BX666DRAFT_2029017 [Dichotomocladium elegans]
MDTRGQKATIERGLLDQDSSTEDINAHLLENVIAPVRRFKLAINSRQMFLQAFCLFSTLILKTADFYYDSKSSPWSSWYMFIDSKILCQNILQQFWNNDDELVNLDYWYQVDRVGVTAFKKLRVSPMSTAIPLKANKELIPYITSLIRADHEEISGRCVTTVEPGQRDLVYFVHENSKNIEPREFQYNKIRAGQGTQE